MQIDTITSEARSNNEQVEQKIIALEQRILRASEQLQKTRAKRISPMELLRRVAQEVGKLMPDRQIETLGPFGLASETAIHVRDGERTVASMSFRPGENGVGLLVVDPQSESPYPPNSLGRVNGLGKRTYPLTGSIQDLVNQFREQEAERAQRV